MVNKNMKIPQDQKNKSQEIIKKIINKAAEETTAELKKYLDELRKIKKEIIPTSK